MRVRWIEPRFAEATLEPEEDPEETLRDCPRCGRCGTMEWTEESGFPTATCASSVGCGTHFRIRQEVAT